MTTMHTGVVVSAKEADAWHAEIKQIMAEQGLNFGEAVNLYIDGHRRHDGQVKRQFLNTNGER